MVQHADFIAAAASYSEHLRTAAALEAKVNAQAEADAKSRGEAEGSTTVGRCGGSLAISGAAVKMPAGCLNERMDIKVANLTRSQAGRAPLVARTAELNQLGAVPTGGVLELQPHGAKFSKPVRLEIQVPEGDENKGLVLLHRDEGAEDNWELLSHPCRAIGPGLVAVDVQSFCFMVLSFPFSGMESLRRIELTTGAPAWRNIKPGMSIDVRCTNKECEAHQERVLCNLGQTRFDLQLDW